MLRALFLACFLCFSASCATIANALPTVIAAVTDAVMILDGIQDFVERYFAQKPNPELAEKVAEALQKTRSALNVALRTSKGADDLNQAKVDEAFQNFRTAYAELMNLVEPLGVASAGDTLSVRPGALQVPEPMALSLKVE